MNSQVKSSEPQRRSTRWILVLGSIALLACAASAIAGTLAIVALSGDSREGGLSMGDAVAVVRVEGIISSGELPVSYAGGAFSERIVRHLQLAEADHSVKAIVLRVNSPGGSAVASNEIYEQLLRVDKPIVASLGETAASGGYYIACAADKIVANRATMTGSIGVISQLLELDELLEKIGVEVIVIKSGRYKDVGSFHRDMTAEERAIFQAMIDEVYEDFVQIVAQGRELPEEKARQLADGRIYTGAQAKGLGLVDELGNLPRAIELAAELGGIEGEPRLVEYGRRERSLLDLLFGLASPTQPLSEVLDLLELEAVPSLQFRYVGP
jgi:protease-4